MEVADQTFNAFSCLTGFILVFGTLSNGVVCITFLKYRCLLRKENILVFSMAVSDFLVCAVIVPFNLISNIKKRWVFEEWGCTGTAFAVCWCGLVSINHLAALAYDRYQTLSHGRKRFFTNSRTVYVAIALWLYSLLFAIAPVIGWSSYTLEGVKTSCSVNWKSHDILSVSYTVCLFMGCFVVPIAVIVFSYYKVYIAVRKVKNNAKATWGSKSKTAKATVKTERKMTVVLLLMCFSFLLAWSPYAVVALISACGRSDWIGAVTASAPAFIAKSSSLCNPIIYFLMYKRFRDKTIQIFGIHVPRIKMARSLQGSMSVSPVCSHKKIDNKTVEKDSKV